MKFVDVWHRSPLTTAPRLELEAGFARRVGERLHATVVLEARAVERDLLDALLPCARSAISLPTAAAASLLPVAFSASRTSFVQRRRAREHAVALGCDDLRVDVLRRCGARTDA